MVGDLFVDLRSGHCLITLLEILTGERLVSLHNFTLCHCLWSCWHCASSCVSALPLPIVFCLSVCCYVLAVSTCSESLDGHKDQSVDLITPLRNVACSWHWMRSDGVRAPHIVLIIEYQSRPFKSAAVCIIVCGSFTLVVFKWTAQYVYIALWSIRMSLQT